MIVAAAVVCCCCLLLLLLAVWRRRRVTDVITTPLPREHSTCSLEDYRAALDRQQIPNRSLSLGRFGISPIDTALANGEPLRIKQSYPHQALLRGCLCVGVGGTRGRPLVRILGLGAASFELQLDKRHLQRARLPAEELCQLEQVAACAARRYLAAFPVGAAHANAHADGRVISHL